MIVRPVRATSDVSALALVARGVAVVVRDVRVAAVYVVRLRGAVVLVVAMVLDSSL